MPLDQHGVYDLIRSLVGQANVLTIPRVFITVTGDHISALLLSQILYWTSRTDDPEGWFYKSAKEWEEELAISDYQLSRATKKLAEAGVQTKLKKVAGAPTQHYRIDEETFLKWISEKLGNGFLEEAESDFRESGKRISESVGNANPTMSAMDSPIFEHTLYTETTAETKTERPFERSQHGLSLSERTTLERYARDFAMLFNDQSPLNSTAGRLRNLYIESGLNLDEFISLLNEAKVATQKHSGTIRNQGRPGGLSGITKAKLPYFFAVIEDLIEKSAS